MSRGRRLAIAAAALVGAYLLTQLVPVAASLAYTGTSPPAVVVEANSMMHVDVEEYDNNVGDTRATDVPFGRVGTIDVGDTVLVKAVDDPSEVTTFADGGEAEHGRPGEVVVYSPGGDADRPPIIHRAMTYVEVLEDASDGTSRYEVRWHEDWDRDVGCEDEQDRECTQPGDCTENERGRLVCTFQHGFRLPALLDASETHVYRPTSSGFVTQGDNPKNAAPDQVLFDREPIPLSWIHGVAELEIPWLGLTELAVDGDPRLTSDTNEHPYTWTIGAASAPRDLWIPAITLTVLWWAAWLGAVYVAYRYVRYDRLPWRDDEPQNVGFDPVSPGEPGQRS